MILIQDRLGSEQFELTGPSRHKQKDDIFRVWRKMRITQRHRSFIGSGFGIQQCRERYAPQPECRILQERSPGILHTGG